MHQDICEDILYNKRKIKYNPNYPLNDDIELEDLKIS